jgi:hypothetical protein
MASDGAGLRRTRETRDFQALFPVPAVFVTDAGNAEQVIRSEDLRSARDVRTDLSKEMGERKFRSPTTT